MSIEQGNIVVTPEGQCREVTGRSKCFNLPILDDDGTADWTWDELIKVEQPLRIHVNSEDEAEFVVQRAGKAGFSYTEPDYNCKYFSLLPDSKHSTESVSADNDLTFDDYEQWTAWLDYHAEDKKCGLRKNINDVDHLQFSDSDEYEKPKTMKETAHNSWMFDDDTDEYDEPEYDARLNEEGELIAQTDIKGGEPFTVPWNEAEEWLKGVFTDSEDYDGSRWDYKPQNYKTKKLKWFHDRLVYQFDEDYNLGYMHDFRDIIKEIDELEDVREERDELQKQLDKIKELLDNGQSQT